MAKGPEILSPGLPNTRSRLIEGGSIIIVK